jgi:hypothetical protein
MNDYIPSHGLYDSSHFISTFSQTLQLSHIISTNKILAAVRLGFQLNLDLYDDC